jgi:hypothetical protein
VANPHKAFGQDVDQPAADELDRFERDRFPDAGVAVFASQEDAALRVIAGEAFFGEGGFGDVSGGVAKGGFSLPHMLAIDAPLHRPDLCLHRGVEFGMPSGQNFGETVADAFDQRLPGNKKTSWRGRARLHPPGRSPTAGTIR